jgi:flavin reductase (DIM6/NTAB) family NADH-FMN oxidoreductase RutF
MSLDAIMDETTARSVGEKLRAALRRIPASVAIVSTGNGADALGVTATSVASVSLDPPTLLACVNNALRLNAAIRANGRFEIAYLRRDQEHIARAFGGAGNGDRFGVGDWDRDAPGGARLRDALFSMSCRLESALESGTHSIFIGQVEALRAQEGDPLLYCGGAYGGHFTID